MNCEKIFNLGVVCGRFGHIHNAHVSLIESSIKLCQKTLVLVGSAQESKTLRNPFTIETRICAIKSMFPDYSEDTLMIRGINDLTNEYDVTAKWGKYVKSQVELHCGRFADLMVYGNDELRGKWFDLEDIANTAELVMPRNTNPISATMVRGYLILDNEEKWKEMVPESIHSMYKKLRDELISVPVYNEIYDKLLKEELSIEEFMKVYKEYEQKDKEEKIKKIGSC